MKLNMFRLKNGDIINQLKENFEINPNLKNKEVFKEVIHFFFKRKIIEKQNELTTFDFINYVNSNFEIQKDEILSISKEEIKKHKEEIILSFNPNMYSNFNGISDAKKILYAKMFFGLDLYNYLRLNEISYLFSLKDIEFLIGKLVSHDYTEDFFETNKRFINQNTEELKNKREINLLNKKEILKSVNLDLLYSKAKKIIKENLTQNKYLIDNYQKDYILIYLKEKKSYLLLEEDYITNSTKSGVYNFDFYSGLKFLGFNCFEQIEENRLKYRLCLDDVFYVRNMFYINENLNLTIEKINYKKETRGADLRKIIDIFRGEMIPNEQKYKGTLSNFCKENNLTINASNKLEESYNYLTEVEENKFYLWFKKDKPKCCFYSIEREKKREEILLKVDAFFENLKKEIE